MTDVRRAVLRAERPATRAFGDHAYAAYIGIIIVVFVLTPIVRTVWIATQSADIRAFAAEVGIVSFLALLVVMLSALLWLGTVLPPAVRSPLATALLAHGPLSRWAAFAGPAVRRVLLSAGAGTALLVSFGATILDVEHTGAGLLWWGLLGLSLGILGGVLMLAGQAAPRIARNVSAIAATLGVVALLVPGGAAMPLPGVEIGPFTLGTLVVAVAALLTVPATLRSLRTETLIAGAERTLALRENATLMDAARVAELARGAVTVGRRWDATGAGTASAWLMFLRRDIVGPMRSPERLVPSVALLVAAGALPILVGPTLSWPIGALSGVLAFAALGPATDAVRHAGDATLGPGLYGGTAVRVLLLHSWLPLALTVVGGMAALFVSGASLNGAVAAVAMLGAFIARVADARKGPMPIALLAPISTPVGDAAALTRLVWVSDAVILSGALAATACFSRTMPWLPVTVAIALTVLAISRWRRRT